MTIDNPIDSKPLSNLDKEPSFDELWQAQVLSMVDALIASEIIRPSCWSKIFGVNLKSAYVDGKPDDLNTYYSVALATLEKLIIDQCAITDFEVMAKHESWRLAYLSTPHGKPVKL